MLVFMYDRIYLLLFCLYFAGNRGRKVGAKSVYLVIIDGGADWVSTEAMIRAKFPWIYFQHCLAHEGSLIIKDICKIEEVRSALPSCCTITQ